MLGEASACWCNPCEEAHSVSHRLTYFFSAYIYVQVFRLPQLMLDAPEMARVLAKARAKLLDLYGDLEKVRDGFLCDTKPPPPACHIQLSQSSHLNCGRPDVKPHR
jgi:hypothetical protein